MNMEIPEINLISDFQAGVKCLQNPSFISRFLSFSSIENEKSLSPLLYSFCKWGALIFALLATLSIIIKRVKLFLICFHTVKLSLSQNKEIEISEDDEISLISSDDEEGDKEEENSTTTSFQGQQSIDEDFCVKGLRKQLQNGNLRQNHWSEFTSGKNVVKLWDSLGLRLNIAEEFICTNDSKCIVSIWSFDEDRQKCNFSGRFWNIQAASSPAVYLTAEANGTGNGVVLGGYDTRMRRRVPSLHAEWRSPVKETAGITGGVNSKVYVRDNVNGILTIGDVRNTRMPLMNTRQTMQY